MKTPKDVSAEAEKIQRASDGLSGFYDRFPPVFHTLKAPMDKQRPTFEKLVQCLRIFDTWHRAPVDGRGAMPAGLILQGDVGQGKSCMAGLICKFAGTRGYQVDYVHSMFAGDEIKASWRDPEKRGIHSFLQELSDYRIDILHLDDIGAGNDASLELCRSVIHFCADRNIFVLATTNLDWKGLREYFNDERDSSRLQRYRSITIPADVPDYRKGGK